jgi:glycosyltransferase involved in cell wall biosynthesis
MGNRRATLAIIASYPPPNGGVSVHVRRLLPLLESSGLSYRVYNAVTESDDPPRVISVRRSRRLWMLRYALFGREPVVYVFSDRLSVWVITGFMAALRGKRVIVRLRNSVLPDLLDDSQRARRALASWAMRRMTAIVAVSESLASAAIRAGVEPRRVVHFPGFLPPDDEVLDRQSVTRDVWDFIESHDPVIAANGRVAWYRGQRLYGLDSLLDLTVRLKPRYPRVGVVVCFWDYESKDEESVSRLRERARSEGVSENILFNTQVGAFVPVLESSTVFVRPTVTDGDANSVREALYLGVPAVASDVVERPPGTVLFKTRDTDDLVGKVEEVLAGERATTAEAERASAQKRGAAYLDFLQSVVARTPPFA